MTSFENIGEAFFNAVRLVCLDLGGPIEMWWRMRRGNRRQTLANTCDWNVYQARLINCGVFPTSVALRDKPRLGTQIWIVQHFRISCSVIVALGMKIFDKCWFWCKIRESTGWWLHRVYLLRWRRHFFRRSWSCTGSGNRLESLARSGRYLGPSTSALMMDAQRYVNLKQINDRYLSLSINIDLLDFVHGCLFIVFASVLWTKDIPYPNEGRAQ